MIVNRSFEDYTWTDISSPTKEELDTLILSKNIDPLIANDLLSPTPRQYAKEFKNALYAVIHIPIFKHSKYINAEQEVDLIITNESLVTTRYDSIDALHHFSKETEVAEILGKKQGSHVFFGLLREVHKFLSDEIEYMKDWLKEIEKNIFEGKEKEMVFSLSLINRSILNFKRVIGPQETVWSVLKVYAEKNFGKKFEEDVDVLIEDHKRIMLEIKNVSEVLSELRETNNSILSTKQSEIMKLFTILAFVTFPLTLIAGIFGMNTKETPVIGWDGDFWIVISIMIAMSLAMFSYFKYKKWI